MSTARPASPSRGTTRIHAAGEGAQLLEPFGLFQRRPRQRGEAQQRVPAVRVEADVLPREAQRDRGLGRGARVGRPAVATNGMGLREK